MRSYQAARSLFSFFGYCAWCLIVVGALLAFGGGTATQAIGRNASTIQFFLGAMPGILMSTAGVFGLAMVQMGRTGVDGAEYAQQSLAVVREQLDISKQMLRQSQQTAAPSFAAETHRTAAPAEAPDADVSDTRASYGNRTQASTSSAAVSPEATALASAGDSPSAPLTHQSQAALPPPNTEIMYRNGEFIVGRFAFKTKGAAQEYQKELLALPRGE